MRRPVQLIVLGLLALSLGCDQLRREVEVTPGPAPEEIQGARWRSLPVHYCLALDGSGFVDDGRVSDLVDQAFGRWGLGVVSGGECAEAEADNGRNEITWRRPPQRQEGVHEAGYTRMLFRPCAGECPEGGNARIIEAGILIHPSPDQRLRSQGCLFSTLLHEAGHFLGVPHLSSPAVMAPVVTGCPQELAPPDHEALDQLTSPPGAAHRRCEPRPPSIETMRPSLTAEYCGRGGSVSRLDWPFFPSPARAGRFDGLCKPLGGRHPSHETYYAEPSHRVRRSLRCALTLRRDRRWTMIREKILRVFATSVGAGALSLILAACDDGGAGGGGGLY